MRDKNEMTEIEINNKYKTSDIVVVSDFDAKERLLHFIQCSKNDRHRHRRTYVYSSYEMSDEEIEIFERTGDKIIDCKKIETTQLWCYEIKFGIPVKRIVLFEKAKPEIVVLYRPQITYHRFI